MLKFSDLFIILVVASVLWVDSELFVAMMNHWVIPSIVLIYLVFSIIDENREVLPVKNFRQVLKVPYLVRYFCAIVRGKVYQQLNFPPATGKGINVVFDDLNLVTGFDSYLTGADPWLVFINNSQGVFVDYNSFVDQ